MENRRANQFTIFQEQIYYGWQNLTDTWAFFILKRLENQVSSKYNRYQRLRDILQIMHCCLVQSHSTSGIQIDVYKDSDGVVRAYFVL